MDTPEQQITPPPSAPTKPKPQKRFWRYVRRVLLVLFLLLLALYSSLQTDFVRGIIISKVTTLIEDETNATVSIKSIGGNFLGGISLNRVILRLKKDTTAIADINEVSVRYSLWSLIFQNQIVIHSLDLDQPKIHLLKVYGDSLWNFQKIVKPSAPSTTPSSAFSMLVSLEDLSLFNGSLTAYDANDTTKFVELPRQINSKKRYINWSNLDVKNLSLQLNGKYQNSESQQVSLEHLSFDEANSPVSIHQLSFKAARNKDDVEIKDLQLITDLTNIKLEASMKPLTILKGQPLDSLKNTVTHLKLVASTIDHTVLAQFLPGLDFIGSTPGLELTADGLFGKLNIKHGKLIFAHTSSISFTGELRNLHQPEKLYLDIDLTAKNLSDATVKQYIPGLGLPDFKQYGNVTIQALKFQGPPDNFATDFVIQTTNGNLKGNGTLDLSKKEPLYNATITTESLNLAPILSDTSLRSNLNLQVIAKGSSFDLKKMDAEYEIKSVSSSQFYSLDMSSIHLKGNLIRGVATADQSKIIFSDTSSADIEYASIDLISPAHEYEVNTTATDAPIWKFVPQFPKGSSVSANATLSGQLSSLSSIQGSLHSVISGLTYQGETIAPISVGATLQRSDSGNGRSDIIISDIADISIKGIYNVQALGETVGDRFTGLIHSLDRTKADSLVTLFDTSAYIRLASDCADSLSCTYSMKLKDLRPLDHFLKGVGLLARGTLKGTIEGCPEKMIDISMLGAIDHFYVGATDSSSSVPMIVAKNLNLDIALTNLTNATGDVLKAARGHINLLSDSSLRIAGLTIGKPSVITEFSSDKARYELLGSIENKTPIRFKGEGSVIGATKTFAIDSFSIIFARGFEWVNEGSSSITISNNGLLRLDTLTIMKPEASIDPGNLHAQRLKLGLELFGDSIRYAYLHSTLLKVSDLPKLFSAYFDVSGIRGMSGRLPQLDVDLNGTMAHPKLKTDFSIRGITYNGVTIDTGKMDLRYSDGAFRGTAMLHVDSDAYVIESLRNGKEKIIPIRANKLQIDIDSIPFLLTLSDYPGKHADSIAVAKKAMSVRVETRDFPLDIFSNVIPVITELHGLGDVKLSLSGDPATLKFAGDANVNKGSFLIPTTNIRYNFEGPIRLKNSALTFDNVLITNQTSDDPESNAKVNGGFYFTGFNVDSFRLIIDSKRLLVLSDASQQTMKSVYGPLVIESGPRPLVFYGTFNQPHLEGDLTIPQASLTLPQTNVEAAAIENDGIVYIISSADKPIGDSTSIVDTTHLTKSSYDAEQEAFEAATEPAGSVAPSTVLIGPSPNNNVAQNTSAETPFMDKMLYNLGITIPGNFFLNIRFNRGYGLSGEQLRAELKSDGVINFFRDRQGAKYETYGKLRLTDQSSYTLIKEFTPTGTIEFQKQLDDPTLDITADYIGNHQGVDTKVRLNVRGTRFDPRISFEIYKKNSQGEYVQDLRTQEDIKNDALFFLATGAFTNDAQAGNALRNVGSGVGTAFINRIFDKALSSTTLKNTIRSVGLELGDNATSRLKLTAGYKELVVRTSGDLSNLSSQDYTVDLPLSTFFSFNQAKNLIIRGEGHTNFGTNTSTSLSQQPFLGRFLYRIPLP